MNRKKCPCCNAPVSFWYYFYQDNFKDSKHNDSHIRCKECGNIILLSWRPRTITVIAILLIFVVSMYLFVEHNLNWIWFTILLLFIFCISYIAYKKESFICYDENKLETEEKSNIGGIVFAIIILTGALITFWNIFSFAKKMKAKNHQKHKVEYIIKDKN